MTEPLFTLPPYDEAIAYLREHFDEIVPGVAEYSAPCALGVLMPEDVRCAIDGGIERLFDRGIIGLSMPGELSRYDNLQVANDSGTVSDLRRLIFGERVPS